MNKIITVFILSIMATACSRGPFHDDKILSNKIVSKENLNNGHKIYVAKCLSCHGKEGDGQGITYRALFTKPRNLTQGLYKFGLSLDGGLPSDEDFARILNHGLTGTAMLPWNLTSKEVHDVTQYIKTFAPQVWEGKNFVPPKRAKFTKDPYKIVYEQDAIKKGAIIYHQKAQCFTCHKAYLSLEEIQQLNDDSNLGSEPDIFQIKPQVSSYYSGKKENETFEVLPVDFLKTNIRSAHSVEEIYQRIYIGVNGTTMPGWSGTIEDEEIWAVAYYVKSLTDQKEEK